MYSLNHVLFALAALCSLALATPNNDHLDKRAKHKSARCFTSLADAPVANVQTTTSTSSPCTSPTTVTTTVTRSVTGGTATALIISTTTAGTSTLTVSTPVGFKPIGKTLPGVRYDGSAGPVPPQKRNAFRAVLSRALRIPGVANKKYVAAVSCNEVLAATQCASTVTATSLSTTGAATTTTSFTTQTFYGTTTTVYPACASNNIANTYKGQIFGSANGDFKGTVNQTLLTADSAFDCCTATVANFQNTLFYGFIENTTYAAQIGGNCVAYNDVKKCRGQNGFQFSVGTGNNGIGQIVLGNLQCAKFNSASTQSTTAAATSTVGPAPTS